MKKIIRSAFFLFLCIQLSSCLSVDRKIKINPDGSGTETLAITFQKEFYGMMSSLAAMMDSTRRQAYLDSLYSDEIFMNETRSKYDSVAGVKILDIHSEKGIDSSNKIVVTYQFDSVSKIGSALSSLNDDNDKSTTIVTWKEESNDIVFDYLYEQRMGEIEGMDMNDSLAQQMKAGFAEMFKGGSLDVQIEFPFEVVSSNAMSAEGNNLHWNYTMSDLILNGKMNLQARMRQRN